MSTCLTTRLMWPPEACHQMWWNGPSWLSQPPEEWPTLNDLVRYKQLPVIRKTVLTTIITPSDDLLERFSNYNWALRVLSWVKCFTCNSRLTKEKRTLLPCCSRNKLSLPNEIQYNNSNLTLPSGSPGPQQVS